MTNRQSTIHDLDVLSIAAHPDDTELTCSGTVIKMVEAGYKVGLLDLTGGESGTRGSASVREQESRRASKVMGIVHRENLGLPDAGVEDLREYKLRIAQKIRDLRPRTVILPYWEGRHPDHYTTGRIGYEACFLAGLAKLPLEGRTHRPSRTWASYSARNSFIVVSTGVAAASPNAHSVLPVMLLDTPNSRSRSFGCPSPRSIRCSSFRSQSVPSRHGVHLPHDSCR